MLGICFIFRAVCTVRSVSYTNIRRILRLGGTLIANPNLSLILWLIYYCNAHVYISYSPNYEYREGDVVRIHFLPEFGH